MIYGGTYKLSINHYHLNRQLILELVVVLIHPFSKIHYSIITYKEEQTVIKKL